MRITSRKGERTIALEARERKTLKDAHGILSELADLADDQRAEDATQAVGVLLQVYSPKEKEAAA